MTIQFSHFFAKKGIFLYKLEEHFYVDLALLISLQNTVNYGVVVSGIHVMIDRYYLTYGLVAFPMFD